MRWYCTNVRCKVVSPLADEQMTLHRDGTYHCNACGRPATPANKLKPLLNDPVKVQLVKASEANFTYSVSHPIGWDEQWDYLVSYMHEREAIDALMMQVTYYMTMPHSSRICEILRSDGGSSVHYMFRHRKVKEHEPRT